VHPGGGGSGGGAKGGYLFSVKENQAELKELIQWAFASYPATDHYTQHQVRGGEVWTWYLEGLPLPETVSGWRGSQMALRMRRSVVRKNTGELREESAYALTSLQASAKQLYTLWRGHWEVENRLHHKRDTVLGEDASRSRKGAAGLMYLRDVILNLLHLKRWPVLRSVRKFSADPKALLRLVRGL